MIVVIAAFAAFAYADHTALIGDRVKDARGNTCDKEDAHFGDHWLNSRACSTGKAGWARTPIRLPRTSHPWQ